MSEAGLRPTWSNITTDKALVCQKQHRCDSGAGTVWFVCLSDGHLLDCGSERDSERRAILLATIINESGPEKFAALKGTSHG